MHIIALLIKTLSPFSNIIIALLYCVETFTIRHNQIRNIIEQQTGSAYR